MNEEQEHSIKPRMVARLQISDLGSPVVQKQMSDALLAIKGVCDLTIEHDAIHVTYDPLQTNEPQLKQAIEKSGQTLTNVETELEMPHPDLPGVPEQ